MKAHWWCLVLGTPLKSRSSLVSERLAFEFSLSDKPCCTIDKDQAQRQEKAIMNAVRIEQQHEELAGFVHHKDASESGLNQGIEHVTALILMSSNSSFLLLQR